MTGATVRLLTAARPEDGTLAAYVFVAEAGLCSESAQMDSPFNMVRKPGASFLTPGARAVEIYTRRDRAGAVVAPAFGMLGAGIAVAAGCETAVSFVPEADAVYEFLYYDDDDGCRAVVQEVYRDDDGKTVREPVATKDPRTCPRQSTKQKKRG